MEGTGTQQPDSLITNYQNKKSNKKNPHRKSLVQPQEDSCLLDCTGRVTSLESE